MVLNQTKTNILKINPRRNFLPTESVKYLGLLFDKCFSWKLHIEAVCRKLNTVCYQLRQLKKRVDRKTLLLVYNANFYSLMSYGIIAWGSSRHANRVLVIQKRAMRIIYDLKKRDSCVPIFKAQKILTFHSVFVLEMVKFVENRPDIFVDNLRSTNTYNLRERNIMQASTINRYRLCDDGIRSMAMKFHNKLYNSSKIKALMINNKSFVSAVRTFLLEACLYETQAIIALSN